MLANIRLCNLYLKRCYNIRHNSVIIRNIDVTQIPVSRDVPTTFNSEVEHTDLKLWSDDCKVEVSLSGNLSKVPSYNYLKITDLD